MPKRDCNLSDDSLSDDSDEPVSKVSISKKPSHKEKAVTKEVRVESKPAPKKKAKKEASSSDESIDDDFDDCSSRGLEPGGYWLEEKRMRRIQVRQFKGKPLIDIREMYMGANGMAPGKKGISLNVTEWRKLVKLIKKVDDEILKIT
ncbi:activated RNA polymerase II transcriptional coactivator p15-like [Bolinopsis microptera]|uniref:activated RNA polymerase II transcriptional coactivator p15-like n=1 Tax=Bolinopsis microptera TaxID=2820187 RepID=UPI0030792D2E